MRMHQKDRQRYKQKERGHDAVFSDYYVVLYYRICILIMQYNFAVDALVRFFWLSLLVLGRFVFL